MINRASGNSFLLVSVLLWLGGCVVAPSPREGVPVVDRSINRPAPPPPAPAPTPQVEVRPLARPEPIRPQEYSAGSTITEQTRVVPSQQVPAQTAASETQPSNSSAPTEISRQGNQPIVALLDSAASYVQNGELDKAGAALERALRIEPRNAGIWYDLAQIRLHQRQYQQAESLASKSNSLAGNDKALSARNWRLIAIARRAMGNSEGADAAEAQAIALEQ